MEMGFIGEFLDNQFLTIISGFNSVSKDCANLFPVSLWLRYLTMDINSQVEIPSECLPNIPQN